MPSPVANAQKRRFAWRGLIRALDEHGRREWRWVVLLAWLIICAAYLFDRASAIHWFSLGDTDDNMRYLQVRDWLNGQSWWDLTQHRMDPPHGANIHWSRIVDLPIAGLMLLFRIFLAPDSADKLALGMAPLIPLLPLMLSLAFIARRLARVGARAGHGWFVAMLLPLGAQMGVGMFMPLRVDHHGWQLALTALTVAGLVDDKRLRGGLVAGVASGLSIAIGMEMMVYLAAGGAILALRWIFEAGAEARLRPYALALAATTAVGYAGFASDANRLPVCDALSPVWTSLLVLAGGMLLLLTLLPLRGWQQRLAGAAAAGALLGAFAFLTWPQCLTGAYQISPELQQSWLSYIREAKPITAQAASKWVPMIAMPLAGLLCAIAGCWAARRDLARLWAWGSVLLIIALSFGLLFWQIRAGPAAQLLAIPPIGWAIWALAARLVHGRGLMRAAAAVGLAVLGCVACAYPLYPLATQAIAALNKGPAAEIEAPVTNDGGVNDSASNTASTANAAAEVIRTPDEANAIRKNASQANARCRTQPALAPLDQLPPAVIFTMVDLGPRLIAVTHHSVIAGPYHRNGEAILDIHHAMDGDPERFREIAAAHGATYLLICPGFPEGTIYQRRSPSGFYARLMRGEKFDFLEPITLDVKATLPYQLYRIEPEAQPGN